jgi:NADPH-dependent ferric siderophore reductase
VIFGKAKKVVISNLIFDKSIANVQLGEPSPCAFNVTIRLIFTLYCMVTVGRPHVGQPSAWVACEFNSMRSLRDYLRTERGLRRDNLYISSYWKHGGDEGSHRDAKRLYAATLVS